MAHTKKICCCSTFGLILLGLGLAVIFLIPALTKYLVDNQMPLLPENPSFPMYRDLPIPIHQKFYFFNVTNPNEIEHGAKPILKEIGPFVFSVNMSKSDLAYNDNQTELSYREWKSFYFDRSLSSHDLSLSITTLNMPLVGMYSFFPGLNSVERALIERIVNSMRPSFFIQATIEELMFAGKKNALSCIAHLFNPKVQPDCYFGYFHGQNATNDGLYKVATGKNDVPRINALITLNNQTHLDFWNGEKCNRIAGSSNGELFPPLETITTPRKKTQFFRTDFCRTFDIYLNESGVVSDVGGILVDRFRTFDNSFDNATMNPDNACYRPRKKVQLPMDKSKLSLKTIVDLLKKEGFNFTELDNLLMDDLKHLIADMVMSDAKTDSLHASDEHPSGVFGLGACHDNLPLFISWPHFMHADPFYLNEVQGLKPNFSAHQTYMNIEPNTGTPIDFIARLQLNAQIDPTYSIHIQTRRTMFPVLWQEFSIHVSGPIAANIRFQTQTLKIIAMGIASLVGLTGFVMLSYSGTLMFVEWHQKRMAKDEEEQATLIPDNTDTSNNNINNNNIIE